MRDVLFRKALRDLRGQAVGWGLGTGLLVGFLVLIYPTVSEMYRGMQIPDAFKAFLGDADLTTFEGYLRAEFGSYGALILAVFAVIAGSGALVGEESEGTLEVLLSHPVTRTRVVLTKAAALAIAMAAVIAITAGFFLAGTLFIDTPFSASRVLVSFALLWPYEMAVAMLSMLAPLAVSGRRSAGALVGLVLGASFILRSIGNIVEGIGRFEALFLTSYYRGDEALTSSVTWGYVAGSVAIGVGALALALILFQRRDIAAHAGLRIRLPWGRRAARAE